MNDDFYKNELEKNKNRISNIRQNDDHYKNELEKNKS